MVEELLARHCAPALAGIKTANIVTCRKTEGVDIHGELASLKEQLCSVDICLEILCECERRVLVIAYRRSVLEKHLSVRQNKAFLSRFGYGDAETVAEYLDILRTRLNCDSFPHEIGVFLGYPLRDIYCFINSRDDGCLLNGEWKVYHDAEGAARMFGRFEACRRAVSRKVAEGKGLAQIFCAA